MSALVVSFNNLTLLSFNLKLLIDSFSSSKILDLCVQNCGPRFHTEIGKFKFLNEMIKVLSPKVCILRLQQTTIFVFTKQTIFPQQYLGDSTPPAVREKCILLLFTWQRDLGTKYPKLREAYQMLKTQNIIAEDPVPANESENTQVCRAICIDLCASPPSSSWSEWPIGATFLKAVGTPR